MALRLGFVTNENGRIELFETAFRKSPQDKELLTVRGRTSGAFGGYGTFLWSSAVQAMSALFVRAKLNGIDVTHNVPLLQGGRGSASSSLDMAISARTTWLADMFGCDVRGEPIARRLFVRSNPSLKLSGPVTVGLNFRMLSPSSIEITIDGKAAGREALMAIERQCLEFFPAPDQLAIGAGDDAESRYSEAA